MENHWKSSIFSDFYFVRNSRNRQNIPSIIAQYEERTAKLKADIPQLEAIISKPWGKETELKQHKSKHAALDRKITAALALKHDEKDGEENIQQSEPACTEISDRQSQSNSLRESMVTEPPSMGYQRELAKSIFRITWLHLVKTWKNKGYCPQL